MKKKELLELRSKEIVQLEKMVTAKQNDLLKIIPETSVGKEKNLKKAKNLKREIAQILTIINEKGFTQKEKENENI